MKAYCPECKKVVQVWQYGGRSFQWLSCIKHHRVPWQSWRDQADIELAMEAKRKQFQEYGVTTV